MAQLRRDYPQFQALNTQILVMVPNGPRMIQAYLSRHPASYPILTDKASRAASQYMQIRKLLLAGTPTVFLVDTTRTIRYAHYAGSLLDEPDNRQPLAVLTQMAARTQAAR